MNRPGNTLVIMAKKPVAGGVKTRLAKTIGVTQATRFYRTLMKQTIKTLSPDRRWQTLLCVSPDTSCNDKIWPHDIAVIGQGRGNLGERMQMIFDKTPPGPVIIIGTDIPDIRCNDIANAFKILGRNDLVFGDAGDGGYWLVGARKSPRIPSVFENVRWSGPYALADTLANAKGLNIGYAATRNDIDTGQDYFNWRNKT